MVKFEIVKTNDKIVLESKEFETLKLGLVWAALKVKEFYDLDEITFYRHSLSPVGFD